MKYLKACSPVVVAALLFILAFAGCSEKRQAENAKPYPLDTCLVCGMKLAGMDKSYAFVYNGQEIKVCDQSEKAEFDKDPAKYMKQLADAEAKPKK